MNDLLSKQYVEVKRREGKRQASSFITLDRIDLNILEHLQTEGRITQSKLAREVGLSVSSCHERLKRLEASGLVRGYYAEIDIARLRSTLLVFVPIELKSHEIVDFEKFELTVSELPEVLEVYAIGGGYDYLLKIVTSDISHYQELMNMLLAAKIGILRYYTYVVTESVKNQHGYPIHQLFKEKTEGSRTA